MCSLPSLISSSCLPSLFFCGHFVSSSLFIIRVCTMQTAKSYANTYFMISLSLMMRLISAIMSELTHTAHGSQRPGPGISNIKVTHSLCGSASRSGSSSCWHIGRLLSDRLQRRGSRTLLGCQIQSDGQCSVLS